MEELMGEASSQVIRKDSETISSWKAWGCAWSTR